ncbi:methylated-DNA--[protein]-cysteine S-methyltransferase [Guyparkeria sp.]|uniref:methylated-DNA--[protein]-cysteine S-methyltransferase n=1 Tax=Guyparkeria sp. TaxID=2035736 RepID=UPI003970B1DB
MSADSCIGTPLGDSNLWAKLDLVDGRIATIRIEATACVTVVPRDEVTADVETIIDALAGWPEAESQEWVDHPLFPPVGSRFQRQVWRELCRIPPGGYSTYGDIARAIGRPRAARAVGQAVGANPWPPLVPCHRVLAAGKRLGGYALGTGIKRRLLRIEGVEPET